MAPSYWRLPVVLLLLSTAEALPPQVENEAPKPHRWTLSEFGGVLSVGLEGHRSFAAGQALFFSSKCADCHRLGSYGKGDGYDLTRPARVNTPEELLGPILSAPAHHTKSSYLTDLLSQEQILDLLAFLLSGGDKTSSLFEGSR